MNMQDSFKKATKNAKTAAGFRSGTGKVAIKIDELLRQHGANFDRESGK